MKKFILLLFTIKFICGDAADPVVTTALGQIKGKVAKEGFNVYLGVPYALIDETNPFGPAKPHPGFTETFEATDDTAACPQFQGSGPGGSLECLQLNVYVPSNASATSKLPVMVYIHGGAFVMGNKGMTELNPKFFIKHDVLVVSINYRLGPFGFLCVSEPGYSNQGLKDQRLAIQWIKDNIEAFGGDASKITLFGQSAGSMSIDLQLLVSEGFVQRAITQSGSALTTWVITAQNDTIPIIMATNLGYTGKDLKEALAYLSSKKPAEVIQSARDTGIVSATDHPKTSPCVESPNDPDALITDFPINIEPKVAGMEIICGNVNAEVMFLYPKPTDVDFYNKYRFEDELQIAFTTPLDVDIVKHFYTGDEDLSPALQTNILAFATDFVFSYPVERSVDRYMRAKADKVYRYLFSYEGGRNRIKISRNFTTPGACHGDDLGYLFDMPLFEGKVPNADDQAMMDTMSTMWTNFAKYGDPTPSQTDVIKVTWAPTEDKRHPYLSLDKPIQLKYRPLKESMAFWDLYYTLHGDKEKGYKGK